jgi:hypothetical protein
VADNNDVPLDDGKECTSETCSNGTPQHPPLLVNTSCPVTNGYWCDGGGFCVECNKVTQCPDPGITCRIAACSSQACGAANAPDGTPLPAGQQIAGDCHRWECDSQGGTINRIYDSDPFDDSNDCTSNTCSSGTPLNPPSSPGTACSSSGGTACDGAGTCVVCACATFGMTCGPGPGACGSLNCNNEKQDGTETAMDCGGSQTSCITRCANADACLLSSDCQSGRCPLHDLVCCAGPDDCNALCHSCLASKTGGTNGICGHVTDGTNPDNECGTQVCNGSGACRNP